METERILLDALAGLWHDIGKFALRSGESAQELWSHESERDIGYRHALASDEFVAMHAPRLWQAQLAGVRYHHRPASARSIGEDAHRQACLVQVADWLSSEEREASTEAGLPRLRSPLSRVAGYDAPWYFPLEPLSCRSKDLFPELATDGQRALDQAYRTLWEQFAHASSVLCSNDVHRMDLRAFVETAYFLLQEYAWCVPSAYYGQVPDVSLFDHARATAAIAACLTADGRDAGWISRLSKALLSRDGDLLDEPVAVLVGGDLTGLQRFLYTIASENAAKSLRGRSVYLQLLSEVIAEYVLDRLGLPLTNLLYVGGGTFYLLVQTTWQGATSEQGLRIIQREIAKKLVEAHGGALGLALAFTPITGREFARERFHEAWDRLHQNIRRQKEFLLGGLDAGDLASLIGSGMGMGGEIGFCEVCGRETPDKATGSVCSLCKSLEELGMQVARANYLLLAEINATPAQQVIGSSWHTVVESFGRRVCFLENLDEIGDVARDILDRAARIRLLWLSEREEDLAGRVRSLGIRVPISLGYRPFAQLVPWQDADKRQIRTFDGLAEEAKGIKRWGVLRMDVDNLGRLMREGFRSGDAQSTSSYLTISRLASLSFALRVFFDKCVPWAAMRPDSDMASDARPEAQHPARLYLQYAGGDDLFMVGAWDALPAAAAKIQSAFRDFACQNPAVTISAGMALFPAKFPIYQAAQVAHEALDAAKSHTSVFALPEQDTPGKNAVSFLGVSLDWDSFRGGQERADRLAQWVEAGLVRKSLLQRILRILYEWQLGRQRSIQQGRLRQRQRYIGPWVWRATYQFGRAASEIESPEIREEVRGWASELLSDERNIVRLGLAARWAELLTRKRDDK